MRMPSREQAGRALAGAVEAALSPVGAALGQRRVGLEGSVAGHPSLRGPETIRVTSPAFADGDQLPDRYCGLGIGEGISPALSWENVPEGSQRLLLVVEDVDFPSAQHSGIHAAAILEPTGAAGDLREGELVAGSRRFAFVRDYRGRRGYAAPRPLPGHGVHRYVFHLFALDLPVTPPADADLASLVRMLPPGHVLGHGQIIGTRAG